MCECEWPALVDVEVSTEEDDHVHASVDVALVVDDVLSSVVDTTCDVEVL